MRRKPKEEEEQREDSAEGTSDSKVETGGINRIIPIVTAFVVALGTVFAVALVLRFVAARDGTDGGTEKTGRWFGIRGNDFVRDGKPFRIISGEFHYFRTPSAHWADRLHKMRLGGLNTVTTYVPWNLHEPRRGKFVFEGDLDLAGFIRQAKIHGLLVIIRPGPYICGEFEWGGLPAWLGWAAPGIRIRSSDKRFLAAAEPFLSRVLSIVSPLQYSNGGPVIAMQIENEYGSFGSDMAYMFWLKSLLVERRVNCVLFDSNGRRAVGVPSLPGVLRTVNFGHWANVTTILRRLRTHIGTGPLFVTEFWCGWFDHHGEEVRRSSAPLESPPPLTTATTNSTTSWTSTEPRRLSGKSCPQGGP